MRLSFYIGFMILLIAISCVDEYKPHINTEDMSKYVVYGNITDQEGFQIVNVSYSSDISNPEYNPIRNCDIKLSDDNGNEFYSSISKDGEYKIWIPKEYLNPGTAYKIEITTPEGTQITSDYDTLYECAQLDTVYYLREDIASNSRINYEKIQFYADMDGLPEHSKYYMYNIDETWEYHTRYAKEWIYDGIALTQIDPPDSSTHICWKTQTFPNIFLLTTEYLSENKFKKIPLHYISNHTDKLAYGYSMEVKQYAISKSAYKYFNMIRNNINNEGGLYSTQPEQIEGNLHNITNPEKEVLGYFFASSVKSKRIFIDKIEDFELYYSDYCVEHLLWKGLISVPDYALPAYIRGGYYLGEQCVDCTERGGLITKPDFWPY